MRLKEILGAYPEDGLDQLARDKLDEIANVRLPRAVLEQEIASALSSFSYIADVLAGSHPPSYAFLKLLMESPDHTVPAAGFREVVLRRTNEITAWIASGDGLPAGKEYNLYRALLMAAWEDGGRINASEANMLEALRTELGLSMREHLLLEHHPEVRPLWDSPRAYESSRNFLLARGLVLTMDDRYALADEVRVQIRRYWGMELHDADYRTLLDQLTGTDLREILNATGLPLSGTKEERIERIVTGLVAPSLALDGLSLQRLKEIARTVGLSVSLAKAELISQLISGFDHPLTDNEEEAAPAWHSPAEDADEDRRLEDRHLRELLAKLSGNQLYEILARLGLPRSGAKSARIDRLVESGRSEYAILAQLRRSDLVKLCRKLGLAVSGLKDELVDRLLNAPLRNEASETDEAAVLQIPSPEELEWVGSDEESEADGDAEPHPPSSDEVGGLRDIKAFYPDLQPDEQRVLALLWEARSLNERDVQRLALRHGLGWMLPKAHMAELLQRLAAGERNPIRIRSTGAANIYEWIDTAAPSGMEFDRWTARDVIDALRQGVVPERGLDLLFVGQEAARQHLCEQMEYVGTGRSAFKFIRGAYGSGKSFISAWLRDRALDAGFAVSSIRVSAELSLADLANFYTGLMDGLRTPEKRGASSFSDILESWLLGIQRKTAQIEGLSPNDPSDRKRLADIVGDRINEELSQLAAHDPGLAPALGAFYQARVRGDEETAMTARAWLRGDKSLSSSSLRRIGVRGWLEPEQVLPRLRAFLEIVSATHMRGLVILIDELELVRRRPHKQVRDQAYETLRSLIDEAGENRLPGCLLVCTGTDTFFEDRRYGLASYEALLHRIQSPEFGENHRSMRQPVIQLEGLNGARLVRVATRTRDIHAAAYDWPAAERVTDSDIDSLIQKWTSFGGEGIDRLPRPFLRQLVHVLDLCEENPGISAEDCFGDPEDDPEANEALLRLVTD